MSFAIYEVLTFSYSRGTAFNGKQKPDEVSNWSNVFFLETRSVEPPGVCVCVKMQEWVSHGQVLHSIHIHLHLNTKACKESPSKNDTKECTPQNGLRLKKQIRYADATPINENDEVKQSKLT